MTSRVPSTTVSDFIQACENKVIVAGYGSLLSRCSRERHSKLFVPTLPVFVKGWERAWVTRAYHENQTYAGALLNANAKLNAQLIPIEIDPAFEKRERDYRFAPITAADLALASIEQPNSLLLELLDNIPMYICETLDVQPADAQHPINFSYIATCMQGAYESDGEPGLDDFITHTTQWSREQINMDIQESMYPRAAQISADTKKRYAKKVLDAI